MSDRETGEASRAEASLQALCANLSRGLHAAAQPLAILRAGLGMDCADRMSHEELCELITTSAREVERVCVLFSSMQQLVGLESSQVHLSEAPIRPLVEQSVDGVDLVFENDGISLEVALPETCPAVLIDSGRMLRTLSGVLLIAHGVSVRGDKVEVIVSSASPGVRVVIRNLNSNPPRLSGEASLTMAIAEAAMRSQHASLSWSLTPFNVQIDFSAAREESH